MARTEALILFLLFSLCSAEFEVPDVIVEVLSPRGLKVSIPDLEGMTLFSFHGQINRPMRGREDGIFSKDVTMPVDGFWTFIDKSARLSDGDVIYYWVKVEYLDGEQRHSIYRENQSFTIGGHKTTTDDGVYGPVALSLFDPSSLLTPVQNLTDTITSQLDGSTTARKSTTTENPCKHTPTLVHGKRSCKGKLIFSDAFNELSSKKWQPEVKFAGDPDNEFVVYKNDPENIYLENHMVYIKPILLEDKYGPGFVTKSEGLDLGENCTGVAESLDCYQKPRAWLILPPVISAQITTKDKFSFTYGIVEIRAKLPKGDWIYPQLYLRSRNDDYGEGHQSGLIRIAFTPGNIDLSKRLSGGGVLGDSSVARNFAKKTLTSEKNWNSDFHIYRMEWKEDSITVLVDNQVYGNIYPPEGGFAAEQSELEVDETVAERWSKGTPFAPFDKEMYIVLGVGVGGSVFPNMKGSSKPWDNADPKAQLHFYRAQEEWVKTWSDSSALIVDYVKVWAL